MNREADEACTMLWYFLLSYTFKCDSLYVTQPKHSVLCYTPQDSYFMPLQQSFCDWLPQPCLIIPVVQWPLHSYSSRIMNLLLSKPKYVWVSARFVNKPNLIHSSFLMSKIIVQQQNRMQRSCGWAGWQGGLASQSCTRTHCLANVKFSMYRPLGISFAWHFGSFPWISVLGSIYLKLCSIMKM